MTNKIYNSNITKRCATCAYAKIIDGDDEILCTKNGIVDKNDICRSFKYDATKRIPMTVNGNITYNEEDFFIS